MLARKTESAVECIDWQPDDPALIAAVADLMFDLAAFWTAHYHAELGRVERLLGFPCIWSWLDIPSNDPQHLRRDLDFHSRHYMGMSGDSRAVYDRARVRLMSAGTARHDECAAVWFPVYGWLVKTGLSSVRRHVCLFRPPTAIPALVDREVTPQGNG